MTANATASIANDISTIAVATESYLGFIDLIFGNDEVIAVEGKKRVDKNIAKAEKAYANDGENPAQAKKDLEAKSITEGKEVKGVMKKTELKEKKIGESLKELFEKIKELFMSIFGKKIPSTALVPFVSTEPNIDSLLNDILNAYEKLCNSSSTEDWRANYEKFKEATQNLGTRLSKCREEIAAKGARYKEMRTKKVNIGSQLRSLEKLNKKDLKDVEELEMIQKEIAKVYQNLAKYYDNQTVKKFLCFGKKDATVDDLNKAARGKTGYTHMTVVGNVGYGKKVSAKNIERVEKHNQQFPDSNDLK